jgi:valyl-tRNA synthetase
MNVKDYVDDGQPIELSSCSSPERWILARVDRVAKHIERALEEYRFNDAAQAVYHYIWHELCDWYLELIKPGLYGAEHAEAKRTTQKILVYVLDNTLRLLHPFMPFISEEIWQRLPHSGESIMVAPFPEVAPELIDETAAKVMEEVMGVITGVRNIRGELGVEPSAMVDVIAITENEAVAANIAMHRSFVRDLAKVNNVTVTVNGERPRAAAAAVAGDIEVFVPLRDLVADPETEAKRLQKELVKVNGDLELTQKKLTNESFLAKAPETIVHKERGKLAEFSARKEKLQRRLEIISELER